jgi:AcrR family transcriptional regulator
VPDPRRRSAAAQEAILRSCAELIRAKGPAAVSIEGVARAAGVGKQTIYRWWPSRGALLVDTMIAGRDRVAIGIPDTGDLGRDLRAVLVAVVRVITSDQGPLLASVLGEMQQDPQLRAAFDTAIFEPVRSSYRARLAAAREALAGQGAAAVWPDDDTVLDLAFGPLWFRALTRPDQVDERFAHDVADLVERALGLVPEGGTPPVTGR